MRPAPVDLAAELIALQAENATLRAQVKAMSVDPWVRERAANDMTHATRNSE